MTHEIEALERRGWEALSGPEGAAFYDDLMADDGLMIFSGLVLDKAGTLRAIDGAPPWASFTLGDVQVIDAGDAAVIAYHATSRRNGEAEYGARMSSVYARIDGRWRLLLHQQSPDPAP